MHVLATIVSETPNSTVPLDETVAAISRFTEPVIGIARARRGGEGSGFERIFDPGGDRAGAGAQFRRAGASAATAESRAQCALTTSMHYEK